MTDKIKLTSEEMTQVTGGACEYDGSAQWETLTPTDAGKYKVGIDLKDAGNYQPSFFDGDSLGKFEIAKH